VNVYPAEVDERSASSGGVDSAVIGVPDANTGERSSPSAKWASDALTAADVSEHLRPRLAGFKQPQRSRGRFAAEEQDGQGAQDELRSRYAAACATDE